MFFIIFYVLRVVFFLQFVQLTVEFLVVIGPVLIRIPKTQVTCVSLGSSYSLTKETTCSRLCRGAARTLRGNPARGEESALVRNLCRNLGG